MALSRHRKEIKTIAVLTSGGDAPGMNAALRAVVRYSIAKGLRVYGSKKGYSGLLDGNLSELDRKSVANIIQRGGTILKTDRCDEFRTRSGRASAAKNLREKGIDALVVIGGDGSFRGAHALWQEQNIPVIGVPGTIDNDINGTDFTIGFDTAVNTAIQSIDKIRDTASSHERTFIVEVMGRNSGHIALEVGIGGGAEAIVLPEHKLSQSALASRVKKGMERGKTSSIIVLAEGKTPGGSFQLAKELEKRYKISAKVCILGHVQRGGAPTARDRSLASRMGAGAVRALLDGYTDLMVGIKGEKEALVPLKDAVKKAEKIGDELINLAQILAL